MERRRGRLYHRGVAVAEAGGAPGRREVEQAPTALFDKIGSRPADYRQGKETQLFDTGDDGGVTLI
jgi:hypothetical protein